LRVGPNARKQEFPLENNVSHIYSTFWRDGKATIHLKLPNVLIYIENANSSELCTFLTVVHRIHKDPDYELPEKETADGDYKEKQQEQRQEHEKDENTV
jgi:hypothetical protein